MKTATIGFTSDNKKEITVTGSNLTLSQEGAFINIKDGSETLFAGMVNHVVYILLKKDQSYE